MTSYKDVMKFLNYVDMGLDGKKRSGGGNSTEPYDTYERMMDRIFGYTRYIFGQNEKNQAQLSKSIDELDQCRKYKKEICTEENDEDVIEEEKLLIKPIEEEERKPSVLLLKGEHLE